MITHEQALEALDNLQDYSMMNVSINPKGAYQVLSDYIHEREVDRERLILQNWQLNPDRMGS